MNHTEEQIEMVFHGPDVDTGIINVRELAPSMLALGSLFESANRILNGSQAEMKSKDLQEARDRMSFNGRTWV